MTEIETPQRAGLHALLSGVAAYAERFLEGLDERPVRAPASLEQLRGTLTVPLPDGPSEPADVVRTLTEAAEPGIVAMAGGRYFGFVIGGSVPAALAADWLTSTWDQNAGLYAGGPAAAVVEEVVGAWLKDLLALPRDASFALVTGCQMAHVTCLAAARHDLLARQGWDVERRGLVGAPPIRLIAGEGCHITISRALRFLGLGSDTLELVAADDQGRMLPDRLAATLAGDPRPALVCAQVGDVNTGAIDPLPIITDIARDAGAWLHVDGAFGLWAAASPSLRPLLNGVERADSWATDSHKWLNVPYDSGLAFCAHPEAHRAAMTAHAAYLVQAAADGPRDQMDWNPEFSRRARGFAVYAALRSLGRAGVAGLVDRSCRHARRFAAALGAEAHVDVLNEVVLNQVLLRFRHPSGDDDAYTRAVIARVQSDGVCWLSGTAWLGRAALRVSVCNWQTTTDDVDRSVAAILEAAAAVR